MASPLGLRTAASGRLIRRPTGTSTTVFGAQRKVREEIGASGFCPTAVIDSGQSAGGMESRRSETPFLGRFVDPDLAGRWSQL